MGFTPRPHAVSRPGGGQNLQSCRSWGAVGREPKGPRAEVTTWLWQAEACNRATERREELAVFWTRGPKGQESESRGRAAAATLRQVVETELWEGLEDRTAVPRKVLAAQLLKANEIWQKGTRLTQGRALGRWASSCPHTSVLRSRRVF